MQELVYDKEDKEHEKKANTFASDTIKEVEVKSKMLSSAVNNITDFANMGSKVDSSIIALDKKIRSLDPSNIDFSDNRKEFSI